MIRASIETGTEYALREKPNAPVQRVRIVEHIRANRWKARMDLAVTQERVPPGRGEVLHYHDKARQLFFVLDGSLTISIDGNTFELRKGD